MVFQIRTNLFFYYRLFFIILFLLLGVSGIGIVALESYTSVDIIVTETDFDKKALHTTSLVMGALGFTVAFIMVFLMREKRNSTPDRRQLYRPLDFPDRRSSLDRRNEESSLNKQNS
jgi:cell division protein FtsW (lipid II flippase)